MMRQYAEVKERFRDAVLLFRMGDFYEIFFEDALTVAPLLELALTSRDRESPSPIPFCGFPHATVDGYGSTCDAYHRVQMAPDGDEIVRAMSLALERARRPAESIGYVSFHGTSTMLNDAVEARCVRRLFGRSAARLAGSSIKSMIGHPQGASGAAGVVAAALALATGTLPPTINVANQDPDCDLDVIPNASRRREVEAALCNCLGFGSRNSALVLGRA